MPHNYYKEGSWNVQCDLCGKVKKRELLRKTWDGFMACIDKGCWYPKHVNEYPRKVIPDGIPVPDARDRNTTPAAAINVNKWSDAALNWNDPKLRWSDDKSTGPTYLGDTQIDI